MIDKVLIALDYNPSAQKVAEEGARLATAMHARITLLHVVADATYYSSRAVFAHHGTGKFRGLGPSPAGDIRGDKKGRGGLPQPDPPVYRRARCRNRRRGGDFADSILDVAQRTKAGVIVMGTHSRRGLDKILMGSVAEKVLRHTTVPTYIIPTGKRRTSATIEASPRAVRQASAAPPTQQRP